MSGSGFQMHAMRVTVEPLAENHAVKGTIKLNVHTHVRLFALHLQMLDLRIVGSGCQGPRVIAAPTYAITAATTTAAAGPWASGRSIDWRWHRWPIHGPMFQW